MYPTSSSWHLHGLWIPMGVREPLGDARSFISTLHTLQVTEASLPVTSHMLKRSEHPAGVERLKGRNLEAYNVFTLSELGCSYTSSWCRGGGVGSRGDCDACWGCSSDLLLTLISSSRSTGWRQMGHRVVWYLRTLAHSLHIHCNKRFRCFIRDANT